MIYFDEVSYQYPFQSELAVTKASFHITKGEIVLCTGISGCGKTTLIRLINGLAPHFYQGKIQGNIKINGISNKSRLINEISLDVGTLFQDPESQFFALNVEDELAFAHEWRGVSPQEIHHKISEAVSLLGLKHLLGSSILDLSEGEKQKIALGAVISLSPKILILDEPTANLDPESTLELGLILKKLAATGITIFIVDHRLYWLKGIAERVLIFENGCLKKDSYYSILEENQIRKRYGLREISVKDPRSKIQPCTNKIKAGIRLDKISFNYKKEPPIFQSASFNLPSGKVIAILGKNGAGKTTFARLLTGLEKLSEGTITFNGQKITPDGLLKKGSIILQNSDHQLHMKTVKEELILSNPGMPPSSVNHKVNEILKSFGLSKLADRHPQSLSGGQKQRLVIACGIIKNPAILILDEPTSGLDGLNMQLISDTLKKIAGKGICVLVISHDLELINQCADLRLEIP